MTENDYVAEYIREKYPRLLGIDFTIWKTRRALECGIMKVSLTCEQIAELLTDVLKKYNATQLSTADVEKYNFTTDAEMKYLWQQSVIRDEAPEAAGDDELMDSKEGDNDEKEN